MAPHLLIEVQNPNDGSWLSIGSIAFGDGDGTISNNHDSGRDIYLFGVDPVENKGYIKKSEAGADIGIAQQRLVSSIGFTAVAELDPGKSYEMTITTDQSPSPRKIKFTYLDE